MKHARQRRPETGGLSYEGMIAIVKTLPDLITGSQDVLDRRIAAFEHAFNDKLSRLEAKLDLIKQDTATKAEVERIESDLNNGFEKGRQQFNALELKIERAATRLDMTGEHKVGELQTISGLEERLRKVENDRAEDTGKWSWVQVVAGAAFTTFVAGFMAWLGLRK